MIVLITKVLCYHQLYVADDLYKIYGDSFKFIQMREPLDWRVECKQEGFKRPYLLTYTTEKKEVVNIVKKAEVIIFGEAPLKLIRYRNKHCLLFKMSEKIYKDTLDQINTFGKIKRYLSYKYLKFLTDNKNSYLLSCDGFAYNDYLKLKLFKNRAFKWGYFPYVPQISKNDIELKYDNLFTVNLIWVSRLVKYKQPLYLIDLVEYLINKQISNFHLTIVGNSDESDVDYYNQISQQIKDKKLDKYITMAGKVSADIVFEYYKQSHIALFTADKSEGWSVGINEAMSCGCAVVSSNVIGAAPFLIDDSNGKIFQYDSVRDLCVKVESIITNKKLIESMGLNGQQKINKIWNHTIAANNLSLLINQFLEKKEMVPFDLGPCSKAKQIKYDWYKEQK